MKGYVGKAVKQGRTGQSRVNRTDRHIDRNILLLEFAAVRWSTSPAPVSFVLTFFLKKKSLDFGMSLLHAVPWCHSLVSNNGGTLQ